MNISARKTSLSVGLTAAAALIAVGVPLAVATPNGAPTAAPPSDSQGYVDSTARCAQPDTAVVFGTTDSSRVAVCQTAAGAYQYRGVRVSDGARLITSATKNGDSTFVAKNDGATYTLTPQALSVTVNGNTFRTETWNDYHGPQAPAGSTSTSPSTSGTSGTSKTSTSASTSATAAPGTSGTAAPSTSGTAAPSTSSAPKTSSAPSSAVPLPPPLPAEVGGGTSEG